VGTILSLSWSSLAFLFVYENPPVWSTTSDAVIWIFLDSTLFLMRLNDDIQYKTPVHAIIAYRRGLS